MGNYSHEAIFFPFYLPTSKFVAEKEEGGSFIIFHIFQPSHNFQH